jgi:hypothetical protein
MRKLYQMGYGLSSVRTRLLRGIFELGSPNVMKFLSLELSEDKYVAGFEVST